MSKRISEGGVTSLDIFYASLRGLVEGSYFLKSQTPSSGI